MSPTATSEVGSALLVTESFASAASVVTVAEALTSAGLFPRAAVALALTVFTISPASTSAWVTS